MATNTMTTLVLSATLACLLVASHVFVRAAPAENELHYSGDNGDNKNINDYTNTITDNNRPSRNDNQRQPRPSGLFGGLFGGLDNGRSPQPPSSYINQNQFGLGEPLFQGPPGFGTDLGPQSLFEHFPIPRLPLIDNLIRSFTETTQNMDRQFKEMSQNADKTRRTFFERNGVAYVETCTTKRVTPGNDNNNFNYGQQQQQQMQQQMQQDHQPMQPGQFQPSQVQPGQMQPADFEQVSPDSDKSSTQDQIVSPVDVSDDSSSTRDSQSGTDSSSPAGQSQTQPGANTQSGDDKNNNNNNKPTN